MLLTHPAGAGGTRLEPYDYEEGTITGAVSALDQTKISGAAAVLVVFENGPSRVRVDGGTPSASVGLERGHLQEDPLSVGEAQKLRMTRLGATNGNYRATYYRVA